MKNSMIAKIVSVMLVALFLTAGAELAKAKTVSFNPVNIPSGGSAFTPNFTVENRGQFTITVKLRTNTVLNYGGQSRYRAELMRSNNTTVLATAERTVSSGFENVTLNYNVTNCNQTGNYRIRLSNVAGVNPQPGQAAFNTFVVPSLTPASGTLPMFGVTQGNTVDRPINLPSVIPSGSGGNMKVTATWDGACLPDLGGCKLTFRLRRNNVTLATSNGYISTGSKTPKMNINYLVPPNQVGGTWSLQVVGSTINSVLNVKPTVSFTPVCQN